MTGRDRIARWVGAEFITGLAASVLLIQACRPRPPLVITGAVLVQDSDPRKQTPIANVDVTASASSGTANGTSDVSGQFRVSLPALRASGERVTLKFRHSGYQPLEITEPSGSIVVARMASSAPPETALQKSVEIMISNPRIRYSVKATNTTSIGSVVDAFEVTNKGNVPCEGVPLPPCSPDNRWKAAIGKYSLDAGEGHEYRNIRLSCIAGPCPFTKIESENQSANGRVLTVAVRDWSDTVTFLLEAEVSQTRIGEVIRQSYPAIFGSTMSFTLPVGAEGPSIEAELNGNDIVFPMGPDLIVSWANCSLKVSPNQGQLYRCELKAGYQFK